MNRPRNSRTTALGWNGEHCQISSNRLAKCFSLELNIQTINRPELDSERETKGRAETREWPTGVKGMARLGGWHVKKPRIWPGIFDLPARTSAGIDVVVIHVQTDES